MARMGLKVYVARGVRPFTGGHATIGNVNIYNMKYDIPSSASIFLKNFSYFPLNSIFRPKFAFLPLYGSHIAKLAKKHEVDVIHANFAFDGFAALLAKNVTKKPLVVSVWGYGVQSDPRTGYGMLSQQHTRTMVVRALNGADAITVTADSHYKTVRMLIGEDKMDKVFFIPMGLDVNRFSPFVDRNKVRKKYGIKPYETVILFARHLRPIYGTSYLIKAAAKVIQKHPETIFLIVGDGPLRHDLEELARQMGVDRNVSFVGYIPRTEMPCYHAASDIFVDPCIFGQGYAAVEALLSGKPVIAFKAGQIRIMNEVDGYLVQPGDVEDLANKMIWLLENPKLRKEMGIKGRKRAVKQHDMENRVRNLMRVYNHVLYA